MSITYPAYIFGSLPLLAGRDNPAKTSSYFQLFQSEFCCFHESCLDNVHHDNIDSSIEFFVPRGEEIPKERALAYCYGNLQFVMEEGRLLAKIKAEQIHWYFNTSHFNL
jgi:hypothetical protein